MPEQDMPQPRSMRRAEEEERVHDYVAQDAAMAALDAGKKRLAQMRTEARSDAVIAVERARLRGGADPEKWTHLDIDALHAVTDLLLRIQGETRA